MVKRTGWNKGTDKPVHSKHGFEVYERMYNDGSVLFCVFYNDQWYFGGISVKVAIWNAANFGISADQSLPWRGLSSPPKGFKP